MANMNPWYICNLCKMSSVYCGNLGVYEMICALNNMCTSVASTMIENFWGNHSHSYKLFVATLGLDI